MTEEKKDERKEDLRGLSEEHPGRSKIQDDPPPIPTRASVDAKDRGEKNRVVTEPPPTPEDLERRKARARSAMPYGTKGSKRGVPAGEPPLETPPQSP
jgi:hypothetical protein